MELESKFIEGTNNQYSIRNDGVILKHYSKTQVFCIPRETKLVLKDNKVKYSKKATKEQQAAWSLASYHRLPKKKIKSNIERAKKTRIKDKVEVTKNYIVSILNSDHNLGLTVKTIDEQLYQAIRARILIKRKLKQLQDGRKESQS